MTSLYHYAWTSLGILVGNVQKRGGSAHQLSVVSWCWCFASPSSLHCPTYTVPFRSSMLCFLLKPPKRGELVPAGATAGPALSGPLTSSAVESTLPSSHF